MRSRTVSWLSKWATNGPKFGSNAISEQVVNPARLSRAHSASSIAG